MELEELKDLIENYQLISANYNKDIIDMQKTFTEEKEIFNKQIQDLSIKIDELVKDRSKMGNDFIELKKQFNKMKQDNNSLQSEISKLQERNKSLENSNNLYSQQVKYMNASLERNKKPHNNDTIQNTTAQSKRQREDSSQKVSQIDNPSKKSKDLSNTPESKSESSSKAQLEAFGSKRSEVLESRSDLAKGTKEKTSKVCNYCRKYHREDKCDGERPCNMCSESGFKCADGKITK